INISWNILLEGTNNVYLRIEDNAYNITTSIVNNLYIKKDTESPKVSRNLEVLENDKYQWHNLAWFNVSYNEFNTINISFMDATSGLVSISYFIAINASPNNKTRDITANIRAAKSYTTPWTISSLDIREGRNRVYVVLKDAAGNILTTNKQLDILQDRTSPNVIPGVKEFDMTTWYKEAFDSLKARFTFSDGDDSSGIREGQFIYKNRDSGQISTEDRSTDILYLVSTNQRFSFTWDQISNGETELIISLNDLAGNYSYITTDIRIRKDTIPPSITIIDTGLTSEGWYNSPTQNQLMLNSLNVVFHDSGYSKLAQIGYIVSCSNAPLPDPTKNYMVDVDSDDYVGISVNWADLPDNISDIYLWANDHAGLVTVSALLFRISKDAQAPVISNNMDMSLFDVWYLTEPTAWISTIDVDFREKGLSGIKEIELIISVYGNIVSRNRIFITNTPGVSEVTENWSISWNSQTTVGVNDVWISMNDFAGNISNELIFSIKRDDGPPNISNNILRVDPFYNWKNSWPVDESHKLNAFAYETVLGAGLLTINYFVSANNGSYIATVKPTNNFTKEIRKILYPQANWAIDWSALTEGVNEIIISASDWADQSTNDILCEIWKDTVSPNFVSITRSSQYELILNNWISGDQISQIEVDSSYSKITTISLVDANSGIKEIYYSDQYSDVIITDNLAIGTLNVTVPYTFTRPFLEALVEGITTISFMAKDHAGNRITTYNFNSGSYFIIKKDTEPPVKSWIVEKDFNTWYRLPSGIVTFNLNISDPNQVNSKLKSIEYGISTYSATAILWSNISNNVSAAVFAQEWLVSWNLLRNGTNDIYIRVLDGAGNKLETMLNTIKKDMISPSVNMKSSQSISTNAWFREFAGGFVTVAVTITDDGGSLIDAYSWGIVTATLFVTKNETLNIKQPSIDIEMKISFDALDEGTNNIYVVVNDNAGNTKNSYVFSLKKDTQKPFFTAITFNYTGIWFRTSKDASFLNNFVITVNDNGSSMLSTISVFISTSNNKDQSYSSFNLALSAPAVTFNSSWRVTWDVLREGTNNIYLDVYDRAGNLTSNLLFYIKKDSITPDIILGPNIPFIQSDLNPWHNQSWFDANLGKIRQIPLIISDNYSGASLIDDYMYYVQNGAQKTLTYNYYFDSVSGLWGAPYKDQNVPLLSYNNSHYLNLRVETLTNGVNEIYVVVSDNAGWVLTSNRILTINYDNISPIFSTANPTGKDFAAWHMIAPSWLSSTPISITDNQGSCIQIVSYSVTKYDDVAISNDVLTTNWNQYFYPSMNISWNMLHNGRNDIYIYAEDGALNHTSNYAVTIFKDTIPPSINVSNSIIATYATSNWYGPNIPSFLITINGITFTDTGSSNINRIEYSVSNNISNIWYLITNNLQTAGLQRFVTWGVLNWSNIPDGINDIYVRISDNAGWLVTSNKLFTVKRDERVPSFSVSEALKTKLDSWYKVNKPTSRVSSVDPNNEDLVSFLSTNNNITYYISSIGNINNRGVLTIVGEMTAVQLLRLKSIFTTTLDLSRLDTLKANSVGLWGTYVENPFTVNVEDIGQSGLGTVNYQLVTENFSADAWQLVATLNLNTGTIGYVTKSIDFNGLREGTSDVFIQVIDIAGNSTINRVFTIRKDTTIPNVNTKDAGWLDELWYNTTPDWLGTNIGTIVTFNDPQPGSGISWAGYTLKQGTVSYVVEVTINATTPISQILSWTLPWDLVTEGITEVWVSANDVAGNTLNAYMVTKIRKDTQTPNYTLGSTVQNNYNGWYSSQIYNSWLDDISLTIFDVGGAGIASVAYRVSVNGIVHVLSSNVVTSGVYVPTWSIDIGSLVEGTNDIYIMVTDNAKNFINALAFFVKVDNHNPRIELGGNSVDNKTYYGEWYGSYRAYPDMINRVTINFVDVGPSGVSEVFCFVSINSETGCTSERSRQVYPFSSPWAIGPEVFLNGTSNVWVVIKDNAGNVATLDTLFSVYRLEPSLTYNYTAYAPSLYNSWQRSTNNIVSNVRVSFQDISGRTTLDTIQYGVSANGQPITWRSLGQGINTVNYGPTFTILWDYLSQGTNDIYVSFNNSEVAITNSFLFRMFKDDLPPTFNLSTSVFPSYLNIGFTTEGNKEWFQTVNVQFSDPGEAESNSSRFNKVGYRIQKGMGAEVGACIEKTITTSRVTWNISELELGQTINYVYGYLEDNAGNTSSVLFMIISWDNIAPYALYEYPSQVTPVLLTKNTGQITTVFDAVRDENAQGDRSIAGVERFYYLLTKNILYRNAAALTYASLNYQSDNGLKTQITLDVQGGIYFLYVQPVDRAGNWGEVNLMYKLIVDSVSPNFVTTDFTFPPPWGRRIGGGWSTIATNWVPEVITSDFTFYFKATDNQNLKVMYSTLTTNPDVGPMQAMLDQAVTLSGVNTEYRYF
ncbi:MAG: hypothetical protein WCH76_03100, partial [Candidatus Riflemargulisbacteria bacterium]